MIDDWDLLRKWVTDGAQDAFTEIVNRHINLVYASARRRLGDNHAAEDVTQAVFLLLSQRAGTLRRRESLPAWLFTAVRYTAANAMKMQRRRDHHEHLAAKGKSMTATMENDPEISRGLLDESIDKLSTSDRTALLLRFFQEKSLADVGAAMGIGENAAEKRVSRAVGRLRKILLSRGSDSQTVLSALAAAATEVAPAHLNAAVISTVAGGANAGAEITLMTKSAGQAMAGTVGGLFATAATILVLIVVAVSVVVAQRGQDAGPPAKPPVAATQPDLVTQNLPFDVVAKSPPDDPATLLQQAHDGIAAAEQKLRTLRIDQTATYERWNASGQWTFAGGGDFTLWIENTPAHRMRDDTRESIHDWTGRPGLLYEEQLLTVYDGTVTKQLTTAGGPPGHMTPRLEGRISATRSSGGLPWSETIYGAVGSPGGPSSPPMRLSEALAPGQGASARRVTLNGRDCVELILPPPIYKNLFVDPSHGWMLVGGDYGPPKMVIHRFVVKSLISAGPGIEIPAEVVGVGDAGWLRFEKHTTIAVANDPAWSDKLFQLEWPPGVTPKTDKPAQPPSNGEHGL